MYAALFGEEDDDCFSKRREFRADTGGQLPGVVSGGI